MQVVISAPHYNQDSAPCRSACRPMRGSPAGTRARAGSPRPPAVQHGDSPPVPKHEGRDIDGVGHAHAPTADSALARRPDHVAARIGAKAFDPYQIAAQDLPGGRRDRMARPGDEGARQTAVHTPSGWSPARRCRAAAPTRSPTHPPPKSRSGNGRNSAPVRATDPRNTAWVSREVGRLSVTGPGNRPAAAVAGRSSPRPSAGEQQRGHRRRNHPPGRTGGSGLSDSPYRPRKRHRADAYRARWRRQCDDEEKKLVPLSPPGECAHSAASRQKDD